MNRDALSRNPIAILALFSGNYFGVLFLTCAFLFSITCTAQTIADEKLARLTLGTTTVLRPIEVTGRLTTECRNSGDDYDIFQLMVASSSRGIAANVRVSNDLKNLGCKNFTLHGKHPAGSTVLIDDQGKISTTTPLNFRDAAVRQTWRLLAPLPYQALNAAIPQGDSISVPSPEFGSIECWPVHPAFEVSNTSGAKQSYLFIIVSENDARIGVNLSQYKADCKNWGGGSGFEASVVDASAQFFALSNRALIFDQTFGFAFVVDQASPSFCLSVPDLGLRYLLIDRNSLSEIIPDEEDQKSLLGGNQAPAYPEIQRTNQSVAKKIILRTAGCKKWANQ